MTSVVYVDFRVAPVDGADYISEFTWLTERDNQLIPKHYFVDYPGAKALERQVVEVIGGTPLIRYSCPTVLRAFVNDLPERCVVACGSIKQKQLLKALLKSTKIGVTRVYCTFDDILSIEGELEKVRTIIEESRATASGRFGNAL